MHALGRKAPWGGEVSILLFVCPPLRIHKIDRMDDRIFGPIFSRALYRARDDWTQGKHKSAQSNFTRSCTIIPSIDQLAITYNIGSHGYTKRLSSRVYSRSSVVIGHRTYQETSCS